MAAKKKHPALKKGKSIAKPAPAAASAVAPSLLPGGVSPLAGGEKRKVLCIGNHSAHPQRLHGFFRNDAWQAVRMDVDAALQPDITGTLTDLKPLPTGAFHAVWCQHVLERFYPHEIGEALREIYRLLAEEGFLLLSVPDAQLAAAFIANNKSEETIYASPAGNITPMDLIYGFHKFIAQGATFSSHKYGFTAETIGLTLRSMGFTNIRIQRQNAEIVAIAYKYGYAHPERAERIVMINGHQNVAPAAVAMPDQPKSAQAAKSAPAAPVTREGALADDLDGAPRIWKPLGLKRP